MAKKTKLEKALDKVDKLPDSHFGIEKINVDELPCVKSKNIKVKKTYMYRRTVIEKIEKMAKKHQVAVGDLISDILEKVN